MGEIKELLEKNKFLQLSQNELRNVEDVVQAITDANNVLVLYKNKHASAPEFKKIAKESEDMLGKALRKIDGIRAVLIKQ